MRLFPITLYPDRRYSDINERSKDHEPYHALNGGKDGLIYPELSRR